jgi:serine/threonine protein kinase
VKIADFGLAGNVGLPAGLQAWTGTCQTLSHDVQSLQYRAPEVLMGGRCEQAPSAEFTTSTHCGMHAGYYGASVDLWSVGVILGEMATNNFFRGGRVGSGQNTLWDTTEWNQLVQIFQRVGTPTEKTWPGLSQLPDFPLNFPKFPPRPPGHWVDHKLQDEGLTLLRALLYPYPGHRITAHDALNADFFK